MFSPPSSEISQHIWQKFGSYLGQPEATFIVRGKKKKKEKKKSEFNAYTVFFSPHLQRSVLPWMFVMQYIPFLWKNPIFMHLPV